MLGIQPGDTSMMAGLGLLYGENVYGGGISSGTLHWLRPQLQGTVRVISCGNH